MFPITTSHGLLRSRMPEEPPSAPAHIETIVLFERLGASLSVAGVVSIIIVFTAFKRLRTVPNTFIIFASIANLGASVACLIGYSGIVAGSTSHLCQAQAFLFELFMQSDPWWSFAMAVNVYMVFFFSANPDTFLRYWYAYFLVCYGIPFISALWLLVTHDETGKGVYGNATIWCWIDKNWSDLRIYTYYLPIWVCIVLSSFIYIAVGYHVFQTRNRLHNLSTSNPTRDLPDSRDSADKNLFANAAKMGQTERKVLQTTTINTESELVTRPLSSTAPPNWFKGPVDEQSNFDPRVSAATSTPMAMTTTYISAEPRAKAKLNVWRRITNRIRHDFNEWCSRFGHLDPVKLAYVRTSFVFAVSVLITWTPSSINRVHDIVKPNEFSYPLSLASAIVLPLQGLWNAFIFFTTSWTALRKEVRAKIDQFKGVPKGRDIASAVRNERDRVMELERRISPRNHDDANSDISMDTSFSFGASDGRGPGDGAGNTRPSRITSI